MLCVVLCCVVLCCTHNETFLDCVCVFVWHVDIDVKSLKGKQGYQWLITVICERWHMVKARAALHLFEWTAAKHFKPFWVALNKTK